MPQKFAAHCLPILKDIETNTRYKPAKEGSNVLPIRLP